MTSSVGIELVSSSDRVTSVKFQKGVLERSRPIDRTPGIPGSDKKIKKRDVFLGEGGFVWVSADQNSAFTQLMLIMITIDIVFIMINLAKTFPARSLGRSVLLMVSDAQGSNLVRSESNGTDAIWLLA